MTEDYEKMRRQLKQMLARRNKVEKELEAIEDKIYIEETSYLQDAVGGNISKGFENYTKSNQNRRRPTLTDEDRIFSQSSTLLQDP